MLQAILADLRQVPGIQPITLLNKELASHATLGAHPIKGKNEAAQFRELARTAVATLVIAPEWDDLLGQRCQWVEEVDGRLLGPSSDTVRRVTDKLLLSQLLAEAGIPTPPALLLSSDPSWSEAAQIGSFPAICKPRWGAGCQSIFLVQEPSALAAILARIRASGPRHDMLLQPLLPGLAASVAMLIGPEQQLVLPAARQNIAMQDPFYYQGGRVPLPIDLNQRAQVLAQRAQRSLDGLWGYVGLDMVLGAATDGRDDYIMEINPRLTTSYIGLRVLAKDNLAEALWRVVLGQPIPPLRWHTGRVDFATDGATHAYG